MTLDFAERAIRHGAIAGCVAAAITLGLVLVALATDASGILGFWNQPFELYHTVLFISFAAAIWRRSRAAAVLGLVHSIAIAVLVGSLVSFGTSLVFAYFLAKAVQGTFAYHRIRREQDPGYQPAPRWAYFVWPPVILLYFGVLGLASLSQFQVIPPAGVVAGAELSARNLSLLRSQEIVAPDEEVVLFISMSPFSVLEDGSILTDRRVISYETGDVIHKRRRISDREDEEAFMASAQYSQIVGVSVESRGSIGIPTIIMVATSDGNEFPLLVMAEYKSDDRFLAELKARWKAAK